MLEDKCFCEFLESCGSRWPNAFGIMENIKFFVARIEAVRISVAEDSDLMASTQPYRWV
jgi:hypothetical protein